MSTELELEQGHLIKADQHIADGEVRVSEQLIRIEKLRTDGHDTHEAEGFLTMLQDTLVQWNGHREEILDRISYLKERDKPGQGAQRS